MNLEQISVTVLSSIVAGIISVLKGIKFIQEGERGVKLRFGRVTRNRQGEPKIYEPGFVLLVPFIDTLPRRHVRQQTIRFSEQRVMLADGLIFVVNAIVIFRVNNVYKALFEIDDLDSSIADLSMGVLRDVLSARKHTDLTQTAEISEQLLLRMKEKAEEWGVGFIDFKITDCAPTPETAHLVNVEIGAQLKTRALKEVAASLGCPLSNLSPVLAAVAVGTPMTAAIDQHPILGQSEE